MSSEHAQLLLMSMWAGSPSKKKRPSLPNRVTNASKGPLSLCVGGGESTGRRGSRDEHQQTPHQHHPHSPRKDTLTRFPVHMLERPIDLVEKELGTISCSQLKDSLKVCGHSTLYTCSSEGTDVAIPHCTPVQNWPSTAANKYTQLPSVQRVSIPAPPPLRTRRKLTTPLQDLMENTAPMNVTITYNNRHAPLTPLPTRPNALTNLSVLAGSNMPKIIDSSHIPSLPEAHTHIPSLPEAHTTHVKKQGEALSCWPHPPLPTVQETKLKPLLNSKTILKGQRLAITHKNLKQQKLEPIDTK